MTQGNVLETTRNHLLDDFVYTKSTGESFPPGQASLEANAKDYSAFFTAYHHEPYFIICWENKDGWEMTGNAWAYVNLPGQSSAGEKITDLEGKRWDMRVPGGFHFVYVKDEKKAGGIGLKSTGITSDSGPVVVELLKRGVITAKDLGL